MIRCTMVLILFAKKLEYVILTTGSIVAQVKQTCEQIIANKGGGTFRPVQTTVALESFCSYFRVVTRISKELSKSSIYLHNDCI